MAVLRVAGSNNRDGRRRMSWRRWGLDWMLRNELWLRERLGARVRTRVRAGGGARVGWVVWMRVVRWALVQLLLWGRRRRRSKGGRVVL
jgi:hypothetical protein